MLRRPKHSAIEVVAPKEEEDETKLKQNILNSTQTSIFHQM